MPSSLRPFRLSVFLASVLLVCHGMQGCLFTSEKASPTDPADPPDGENPGGGGNPLPAGRGYYTIDLPTASSRLNLDSTYTVQWRASNPAGQDPVRISIYRNDTLMGALLTSAEASGSFGWNLAELRLHIGNRIGSGTGYRLRIMNEADSSRWDFGPRFDLYSDYSGNLELTVPVAGAHARGDTALHVAWTAAGAVGSSIGLQLYRDTTMVWEVHALIPAADGEFTWSPVPEWLPSGDGYRFRIYSRYDVSIEQMGPAFTLTLPVLAGTYEFLRPRTGDIWVAGEVAAVEWAVTGNPGSMSMLTLWRDSPRELAWGWTPIGTSNTPARLNVPSELAGGTYRLRVASLVDSTLFAFSPPFNIQAAESP